MPYNYNDEVCIDVATRMTGEQTIESISTKRFKSEQNIYQIPTITRDQIKQLGDIMTNNSKITLTELQQKAIDAGIFPDIRGCPAGGKREFNTQRCMQNMAILWDNAPSHLPTTPNRVSPFHKYCQDVIGLGGGVVHTPPYSAWCNPVVLFFSYVKRYVRKYTAPDVPSLLQRLREATERVTGTMIKNWFRKAGFELGPPAVPAVDPNAGVDRRTLPRDAKFDRKEHVLLVDAEGKVRREKKVCRLRWSKYDDDADIEGELKDISVVGRSGIRRQPAKITECKVPLDAKLRWTGIGDEPPGLVHGSYEKLFSHPDDLAEIEMIVDERETDAGEMEYRIRWKDRSATEDEWIRADAIQGLAELLRYWRARNARKEREKDVRDNKREAKQRDSKRAVVQPINRTDLKVGDTVALLSSPSSSRPFYLGRILKVTNSTIEVHWYHNTKVDGTYTLEYARKKGRGVGAPSLGRVYKTGC